jgi:hypothetical protein
VPFIDLFCGAGGLSLGLEADGFRPTLAIDEDLAACQTYVFNRPYLTKSAIRQMTIARAIDEGLIRSVPLLVGGPPCQGFSNANKQRLSYTYFGQQSRPQRGASAAGSLLKAQYENMPCIWDHPRRRFVRPRDCFSDRVSFFEPHKVFVGGDAQVQAGLDSLGRRQTPQLDDYVEFLELLRAHKFALQSLGDGGECDSHECQQILNALHFVASPFDHVDQDELPVLTTAQQLLPISNVFEDDAPHFKGRIEAADINLIDPHVPHRIRSAAPGLANAIVEMLDELPMRSVEKEIENVCQRFAAILHSQEFAQGLR